MKIPRASLEKYKNLVWIWYPVVVFLVLLLTIQFVVGGSGKAWVQLRTKQKSLAQDKELLNAAQTKLANLRQLNKNALIDDVRWTDQVIPSKKQIAVLVNQLRYAGVESGSALISYAGVVGDVASKSASPTATGDLALHADYLVPGMLEAQKLLTTLEKSFPLIKIIRLTVSEDRLGIDIVSAWQPVTAVAVQPTDPLPNYVEAIKSTKQSVADFVAPVLVVAQSAPVDSSQSAQLSTDPFTPLPSSN